MKNPLIRLRTQWNTEVNSVKNYILYISYMKVKNEYQRFFGDERFTHHITLPPSKLNEKSVLPILQKIEFKLN